MLRAMVTCMYFDYVLAFTHLPSTHSGKYADDRVWRPIFVFYAKTTAVTLRYPNIEGKFFVKLLNLL